MRFQFARYIGFAIVSVFVDAGARNAESNYSAREHGLGPMILNPGENPNAAQHLFDVAIKFLKLKNGHDVPDIIRSARLKHFGIGVGSEASCISQMGCSPFAKLSRKDH